MNGRLPFALGGVDPPTPADREVAANFYQAYHLYQFLTTVTSASQQLNSGLGTPVTSLPATIISAATEAANSAAMHLSAIPSPPQPSRQAREKIPVELKIPTEPPVSVPVPQISAPVTPPSGLDLQAMLARMGGAGASTASNPMAVNKRDSLTPTKRVMPFGGGNDAAPSPVSEMLSGLKRRRVRVIQSNDASTRRLWQVPQTPEKPEKVNLVARLNEVCEPQAGEAWTPTGGERAGSDISTNTASPCTPQRAKSEAALAPRKVGTPLTPSKVEAVGSWSEEDKKDLISVVAGMKPCGAADWEDVAERLNALRPSALPRRGASAERMYRTLTDPGYSKATNPHGRRIRPRKGHTPMHVMATYSLQKLPNNEGNLTEITDLITRTDRFAAELDWTPRPGTKTYPRWKDALVGCFKPGRYEHLVKTDRKVDGLTVYKLLPDKLKS